MKLLLQTILYCVLLSLVATQENDGETKRTEKVLVEAVDSQPLVNLFRVIKNTGWKIFGRTSSTGKFLRKAREQHKFQDIVPSNVPFPCSTAGTRSEKRPKTVNQVRPGDIDVVGALGDSLTAGNGIAATNFISVVFGENRGLAFTIGGQSNWRQYLTLPNILKMFNPKLIGYSLGDSLTTDRASQFNVAEGGAVSRNTPYMAKLLVKRITKDPRVDVKQDWKMINYLIGGNDFCSEMCYYKDPEVFLERHKQDVLSVLRTLRDNLPRTIVNLLPGPNVQLLKTYNHKPEQCHLTHSISCPCIWGEQHQKRQQMYAEIMTKWQLLDLEISNYPEFDTEDFAVVFQPFVIGYKNPGNIGPTKRTDYTYTSDDCFHFSQKGNAQLANLLWNNLMEPVGQKSIEPTGLFQKFNCPTEDRPFIFTKRNSGLSDDKISSKTEDDPEITDVSAFARRFMKVR